MAKYVFESDLSVKGIQNLKKQLLEYRNQTLPNKLNRLLDRLAQEGYEVANVRKGESPLGKYVHISVKSANLTRTIIAKGEVMYSEGYAPFSTILAIEFGAGVTYNPDPNPNADKFGFGVGTFPEQKHARDENGWYFWDESKEKWVHSYGVKATMPMYEAEQTIRKNIDRIVKEVFKNVD